MKPSFRNFWAFKAFLISIIGVIITSCGSGSPGDLPPGDTLTTRSSLLILIDHGNGIVSATVKDPWNNDASPRLYLLVRRGTPADSIPEIENAIVIETPIRSALVYSSVHASVFDELGAADLVSGVADGQYFSFGPFPDEIRKGRIKDVGNSMSPSLEAIVDLSPDVALISPYQNAGHGILDKTGIPVVEMADYMETSPLARAEWILMIGALTDKLERARKIYQQVVNDYEAIRSSGNNSAYRPLVIAELPSFGTWYQPGGQSYASVLIRDAGGRPVTEGDGSAGSLQLDEATAFDLGAEADVWLIKTDHDVSMKEVSGSGPLSSQIKAYRQKNIFSANTSRVPFFDHVAFHPERILRDYASIFSGRTDSLTYFSKIKNSGE